MSSAVATCKMSIPHLFRCPISLDIFTDPVTLCTGQTYDRASIEKWLAGGNLTCPVTMQRLHDTSLVPNHTLRHLIDQWLMAGPDPNVRQGPAASTIAPTWRFSLSTLKLSLQSSNTTAALKLEALRKVRTLSVESDAGQACLVQLGFFQVLLQLLFQAPSELESELIEVALDCVLSLSSSSHLEDLNVLKEDAKLLSLVRLLERGNANIQSSLCYLLDSIATSLATQELCQKIGQLRRVWQPLVALMQNRYDANASEAGARAVSGLCSSEHNRGSAVRNGAVDGTVAYLSYPGRRHCSRALATLELLLGLEEGKKALAHNPDAIQVLVKMVFRVSSDFEGSEHAVGSLLIACRDSPRATTEAANAGVLRQLLLLLQSQCSSQAKANARALLKLLRPSWADKCSPQNRR